LYRRRLYFPDDDTEEEELDADAATDACHRLVWMEAVVHWRVGNYCWMLADAVVLGSLKLQESEGNAQAKLHTVAWVKYVDVEHVCVCEWMMSEEGMVHRTGKRTRNTAIYQ
jgi:hypothetical protein